MKLLELEIHCPQCGGTNLWHEYQRINHCRYCASLLSADWKGSPYFYVEPVIASAPQLLAVLVMSKAEKARAESIARYPVDDDRSPTEMLTVMTVALTPFLDVFRRKIKILNAKLLYVPYWHFQAVTQQCLLTAADRETKQYLYRRTPIDQTFAAYDTSAWNFRDRGLRFKETRLKEAADSVLQSTAHLSFSNEPEIEFERILRGHRPPDDHNYMFKFQYLAMRKKIGVFRPYWIVQFICDREETVIVDAVYGTVAGYPGKFEASRLMSYSGHPCTSPQPASIQVVPSRCPICGADARWKPNECVHFCANCGRALVIQSGKVKTQSYRFEFEIRPASLYLPFWKFRVRLKHKGKSYQKLRDYYSQFFPGRLIRTAIDSESICIPAFSPKRSVKGDQLFEALIADASASEHRLSEGPIQPVPKIQNGTEDVVAASELLLPSLPSASAVAAAHMRSAALSPMLKETTVTFDQAELVLLPYSVNRSEILIGGRRFPVQKLESL